MVAFLIGIGFGFFLERAGFGNARKLMAQFYLTDICEKIPFSAHQIRYQVRQNDRSREQFGVWKDEGYKTYIVEMETFSNWIQNVWSQAIMD